MPTTSPSHIQMKELGSVSIPSWVNILRYGQTKKIEHHSIATGEPQYAHCDTSTEISSYNSSLGHDKNETLIFRLLFRFSEIQSRTFSERHIGG
jgi:hypothetical protein